VYPIDGVVAEEDLEEGERWDVLEEKTKWEARLEITFC
jgi:hypothetical protein